MLVTTPTSCLKDIVLSVSPSRNWTAWLATALDLSILTNSAQSILLAINSLRRLTFLKPLVAKTRQRCFLAQSSYPNKILSFIFTSSLAYKTKFLFTQKCFLFYHNGNLINLMRLHKYLVLCHSLLTEGNLYLPV